jgi:hypothetical protein
MGIVYLLGDRTNEGVYKIGVTRGSLENRIKKLQTGSSGELYVVNSFKTEHPFILEKMLHNKYFGERVLGEWYELNDEEVFSFTDTCETLQKRIEFLKENNFFFRKKFGDTN